MSNSTDVLELEDKDSIFHINVGIATRKVNIFISLLFLLLLPFAAIFLISFNLSTIVSLMISDNKIKKILDDPNSSLSEITALVGNRISDERYCELMNENYFSIVFCQEYQTIEYVKVKTNHSRNRK